ncbi:MAG: DUF4198 domain-containing protein [Proteobacteria bacterium]|nr:DUF4198 domain-containing protein [Pseudomonadota bacterium]
MKTRIGRYVKVVSLLCMCLFALQTNCYAHFPWINVLDYTPETGAGLKMTLNWGHAYPFSDFLKKSATESVSLNGPGNDSLGIDYVSEVMLASKETITTPGTYIVSAVRKPGFYTKTKKGGKRSSKQGLEHVIKCSFSQMSMKAVVNAGNVNGPADRVLGHPMEIVPLKNPGNLRSGDDLPIWILLDGKPYSGTFFATYAGFSTQKETFAYASKTDKKGLGNLKILTSGVWVIKAVHEQPYPDKTQCDSQSFIATLTFQIN